MCLCLSMHAGLCAKDPPSQSARQLASTLTFHPAAIPPSPLYISLSSSISLCLHLHQGKCQCTHLSIGLADQSGPGYIYNPRWSQKTRGERVRINQARPQTPAAGRLARHGEPESWNHLVPGLGCRTLATPAGPVKQHWSSKHTTVP